MTKDTELRDKIFAYIDDHKDEYIEIAQHLYDNPEIANEEFESSKYLVDFLKSRGFEVEYPFCGLATAFKATKKNGEGPRICYMAEYDALPNVGHACGHNWIAADSIGSGVALAQALEKYPGEVTIFGTPAEETGDGKPAMVEAGAFDGYDAAMEFHGNFNTCLTPDMIGVGGIDIHFTGQAAHAGGNPSDGVNAMDAVLIFFTAINALRQQLRDGTRLHGIIVEAGKAVNIIPDEGKIRLEIRTRDMEYWNEVLDKVVNCAKAAALATGCEMEWHHFEPTCAGMSPNMKLVDMLKDILKDYPVYVEGDDKFSGGASDVGNVSQVVPTVHPMMKITEKPGGNHTTEFWEQLMLPYAKERNIEIIKIFAELGLQLLEDPELTASLKEDKRKPQF